MFSVYGDTVLDPFLGTGTTCLAAAAAGRSSIGVERDAGLEGCIRAAMGQTVPVGRQLQRARLTAHRAFVAARLEAGKDLKHVNIAHDVPVITRQEINMRLREPAELAEPSKLNFIVKYPDKE